MWILDKICFIWTMYKIIENISIFSGNTKKFQFMNDSDSSILLSSAVGEFEDLKGEVVIEGLSKEQGLFIFLPKYGGGGFCTPALFRRSCTTTQWQHFLDDRHTPKSFITKVELNKMKINLG